MKICGALKSPFPACETAPHVKSTFVILKDYFLGVNLYFS